MCERQWYYKLENGQPVPTDMWGWGDARERDRRVALTHVGEVEVSTVWLGLDHQHGDGPPLLWETMVFGGEHDDYCERYSSRQDADAGHTRIVEMVKAAAHASSSAAQDSQDRG